MLLYETHRTKINTHITLSMNIRRSGKIPPDIPCKNQRTKALQCVRPKGSFTVEAAFAVPLFLFAAVVILGLFQMLLVQLQVTKGLQYASRTMAASCCEAAETDDDLSGKLRGAASQALSLAGGELLFRTYLKEHGCREDLIVRGLSGISFAGSDLSGEYVVLRVSYRVRAAVSFWGFDSLPVSHCVRSRKWIGATEENGGAEEDGYVYVTERGEAYHKSASCPYLDLSVRSVPADRVGELRSKDGSIYRRCGCCREGQTTVYVTDYGTQYHGSLTCGDLKRTVYKVRKEEAGSKHACAKCYGGEK